MRALRVSIRLDPLAIEERAEKVLEQRFKEWEAGYKKCGCI
ncbi:hypothetical protein ALT1644_120002 [Alteromonas macleodii]